MTPPGDPNYLWEFRAEDFVFARLEAEQRTAEALPEGLERSTALTRIESLRLVAAEHCIYVDHDRRNHCRCFTCEPACGVPCRTVLRLARLWRDHPDYVPGWNDDLEIPPVQTRTMPDGTTVTSRSMDYSRDVAAAGGWRRLRLQQDAA